MARNKVLFVVLLLIGCSGFAFSQTAETKNEQLKISVCRPKITEAGRQSSFQFAYRYTVLTDEKGSIKEVREISANKNFRSLMNDEDVIPCIKEWSLRPSERYFVTIFVGTTGEQQFFSISSKTANIKILL